MRTCKLIGRVLRATTLVAAMGLAAGVQASGPGKTAPRPAAVTPPSTKGLSSIPLDAPDLQKLAQELAAYFGAMKPDYQAELREMGYTDGGRFTRSLTPAEANRAREIANLYGPPAHEDGLRGPGPVNDLCSGAIEVFANTPYPDNNTAATSTNDGPAPTCQSSFGKSLWYRFTPAASGLYQVDVCNATTTAGGGTIHDTVLTMFTTSDCTTYTQVACDDDSCVGTSSRIAPMSLIAGVNYFIRVSSFGSSPAGGTFTLNVISVPGTSAPGNPPANDTCATAIDLLPGGTSGPMLDINAGADTVTSCSGVSSALNGVWFHVVGNGDRLVATTCGSTTFVDTTVLVFTGTCGSLVCVSGGAATTPVCVPFNSGSAAWCSAAGVDYYVCVANAVANDTSWYTLTINDTGACAPDDNCAGASVVPIGTLVTGDTTLATPDGPANSSTTNGCTATFHVATELTVWRRFTPPTTGVYTISLCASSFNTKLSVYPNTGSPCSGTVASVACNDDSCGTNSSIAASLTGGQEYYLRIAGSGTAAGTYRLLILGPNAPPAPINDDICSATTISDGSTLSTETLVGATGSSTTLATCATATTTGDDVWYTFTPAIGGNAIIRVCGNFDTVLSAYTAAGNVCSGTLTLVSGSCNDDTIPSGCTTHGSQSAFTVVGGTPYWVRVAGVGPGTLLPEFGTFTISAQLPQAPPPNDACASPVPLTIGTTIVANNNNATNDTVTSCNSQTTLNNGVWYSFTGNGDQLRISTCGADTVVGTRVSVFSGTCAGLVCVDSQSTATPACAPANANASSVTFCSNAGTPYLVVVSSTTANTTGVFDLTVSDIGACTPGDLCAIAITIPSAPATIGVDTSQATSLGDGPAPTCQASFSRSLWFRFTPAVNSSYQIDTVGSVTPANDTVLTVFTTTDCVTFTQVGCDDDTGGNLNSLLSVAMTAGQPYYIRLSQFGTAATGGPVVLHLTPPPANDTCAGALPITIGGASVIGSNQAASADTVPTCGGLSSLNNGVWYTFTGNAHVVNATTCNPGTAVNSTVAIFSGSCAGLTCVGLNATAVPACSPATAATVTFCAQAGVTYYAVVASDTNNSTGQFELSLVDTGPCDTADVCAGAIPVSVGGSSGTVSNAFDSDDAIPSCNGLTTAFNGKWFQTTGTGNILRASTCSANTTVDTTVSVFSGSCGALVCAGGNATATTPACAAPANAATVNWCSSAGATYYILVSSGVQNVTGNFELLVSDQGPCPANDLCSGAVALAVPSVTVGSTVGATLDSGVPQCPASDATTAVVNPGVWYKVTGTGNIFQADTCDLSNGQFDTKISVFCGTNGQTDACANLANLTCITGIDDATLTPPNGCGAGSQQSQVSWPTQVGAVYLILVHGGAGSQGSTGAFTLTLSDLGAGSNPVTCIPTGACCLAGSCSITTQASCNGAYLGDGSDCTTNGPTHTATSNPNVAIPDNVPAGVSDTQTISDSYNVGSIAVTVSIPDHTFIGDLIITLTHGATSVTLWSRQCGTDAGMNVTFRDGAIAVVCAEPTVGTYAPFSPLSAFLGQSVNGGWTLNVSDNASIDTGHLASWTLTTRAAGAPCVQGPDCFSPLVGGVPPQNAGHFTRGQPDNVLDQSECLGDWDRDHTLTPADIATYVSAWFYSAQNPGNTDADVDCDGVVLPADVANFVNHWFAGLSAPASEGC